MKMKKRTVVIALLVIFILAGGIGTGYYISEHTVVASQISNDIYTYTNRYGVEEILDHINQKNKYSTYDRYSTYKNNSDDKTDFDDMNLSVFDEDILYTTVSDKICIYKVDDKGKNSLLSSIELDSEDSLSRIFLYKGQLINLTNGSDNDTTIRVIDVSDNSNPKITKTIKVKGTVENVGISGHYMHIVTNITSKYKADKDDRYDISYIEDVPYNEIMVDTLAGYCITNEITIIDLEDSFKITDEKVIINASSYTYMTNNYIYMLCEDVSNTIAHVIRIEISQGLVSDVRETNLKGSSFLSFLNIDRIDVQVANEKDGCLRLLMTQRGGEDIVFIFDKELDLVKSINIPKIKGHLDYNYICSVKFYDNRISYIMINDELGLDTYENVAYSEGILNKVDFTDLENPKITSNIIDNKELLPLIYDGEDYLLMGKIGDARTVYFNQDKSMCGMITSAYCLENSDEAPIIKYSLYSLKDGNIENIMTADLNDKGEVGKVGVYIENFAVQSFIKDNYLYIKGIGNDVKSYKL